MNKNLMSLIGIWWAAMDLLIAQPSITILLPRENDQWTPGSTYPVRWAATSVDSIRIDYSTAGVNGPWVLITPGIPSSSAIRSEPPNDTFTRTGSYYWIIPHAPTDSSYIRISDKSNPSVFDKKHFVITTFKSWIVQVSDVDLPLYTVQTVSQGVGWAGGKNGLIMKTVDTGVHWLAAGMVEGEVRTITADQNLVIAGSVLASGAARIYRTSNGDGPWSIVDTTRTVWRHIRLFNTQAGYAFGDPVGGFWVLKRTTNGGVTWFDVEPRVPAAAGYKGRYNAMVWRDASHGWFGTNGDKVYRTTDGGATWIPSQLDISNITAIHFSTNTFGLVGAADGSIRRTSDGGANWTPGTSTLPSAVLSLSGLSSTLQCWAVCNTNVYWTQDSGKTWSTLYEGYVGLVSLGHLSLGGSYGFGYGWAVGDKGTILRYSRIITDVPGVSPKIPNEHALYQNYPNPFNPTTTIRYFLSSQERAGVRPRVSLRVFDLLGREVATLVDEVQDSGFKTVTFDGTALASGVYFFRMQVGSFVQTRKLLLLR